MAAVIGWLALAFVVSFLLGSIPWGVIVSKLAFKKDLRDEGSGNIGTTNAMRTLGKAGGAAVFVLDFGKGIAAGALAAYVFVPAIAGVEVDATTADGQALLTAFGSAGVNPAALAMALAFAGCTLGHIFSPWLKFKGGKGIAVAAACLLFVYGPVGFLVEIAVFAAGIALTRCVSVGSIAAAVVCPLLGLYYYGGQWVPWLIILATACVVVWAHRANIGRLRTGTENKIGSKKK
ncbi:glycerol-3-phosphate acyltransferase [Adlercreutzia sp. R21]|uniref:glycerol-3-phosphate acyltransferase n=1 Tax=Adlercreutzia wanghongyangiae TaxID=3111451 RepID=UPI002DBEEDCA|nr:glycerol-3-phosphate acyltransferase [Adlercreutzia sp. R21]MEC4183394.1 glycerol-3-phosphate acyltransferase [Adlercreutzia sp. R21]